MAQRIYAKFTLIFALLLSAGAAHAGSESAFFGVGLTVLAAKPKVPSGVIYRNAIYTPGAVAIGLQARGYANVTLLNRNSDGYLFSAVSRSNGQHYILTVAAWRGEVVSAVRG